MKVLHVIPSISLQRGGPSQAVLQMVKALREAGVDARIVTTQDNGLYRITDFPVGTWFLHNDVPILIHRCVDSRFRFIREYLISLSLMKWLLVNITLYDIVHFHAIFSFPSTIGMLISRFKRVPYIVRTIGQLNSWSLQQGLYKKKLMFHLVEKGNLESAHAIHVTSILEQGDLDLLGIKQKPFLCGLGVDLPRIDRSTSELDQLPQPITNFLFLSRLHPKKQIELLFQGLSILKNSSNSKNWLLSIAGTGDHSYMKYLLQLTHELCIDQNVLWKGHLSGSQKDDIMRHSDWYVLTSASENFAISAVEAMSYCVPVIITDQVGISEKVKKYNAGFICEPTPSDIATILYCAIHCTDKRFGARARRLVEENFTWPSVANILLNKYYDSCSHISR